QVQPLADRQLAALMLLGDAFVTAHGQVLLPAGMQVRYLAGVVVTQAGILLRGPPVADEQVLAHTPAVEKAVKVAAGQPVPFRLGRGLPRSMLVTTQRKFRDHSRLSAAISEAEAQIDIRDPVEAKFRVESVHGLKVLPPESHAVALDRVDIRSRALSELLHGAARAQAERPRHRHRRIGQRGDERRDGIASQLNARVKKDADVAGGGFTSGIGGDAKTQLWIQSRHT